MSHWTSYTLLGEGTWTDWSQRSIPEETVRVRGEFWWMSEAMACSPPQYLHVREATSIGFGFTPCRSGCRKRFLLVWDGGWMCTLSKALSKDLQSINLSSWYNHTQDKGHQANSALIIIQFGRWIAMRLICCTERLIFWALKGLLDLWKLSLLPAQSWSVPWRLISLLRGAKTQLWVRCPTQFCSHWVSSLKLQAQVLVPNFLENQAWNSQNLSFFMLFQFLLISIFKNLVVLRSGVIRMVIEIDFWSLISYFWLKWFNHLSWK